MTVMFEIFRYIQSEAFFFILMSIRTQEYNGQPKIICNRLNVSMNVGTDLNGLYPFE